MAYSDDDETITKYVLLRLTKPDTVGDVEFVDNILTGRLKEGEAKNEESSEEINEIPNEDIDDTTEENNNNQTEEDNEEN